MISLSWIPHAMLPEHVSSHIHTWVTCILCASSCLGVQNLQAKGVWTLQAATYESLIVGDAVLKNIRWIIEYVQQQKQ